MPIPPFDGILNVLPPHLGNPAEPGDLSPYVCTTMELCDRFATSPPRKTILEGFLKLRRELMDLGVQGFHWLDGSFLEAIETQESRDPRDMDVVTFVSQPDDRRNLTATLASRPDLLDRAAVKHAFSVDHFLVPLSSSPQVLVDLARYWYGLFSHRRDRTWKGMLRIDLLNNADDDRA